MDYAEQRQALIETAARLSHITLSIGDILPADFPSPSETAESVHKLACWIEKKVGDLPRQDAQDYRDSHLFVGPYDGLPVMQPQWQIQKALQQYQGNKRKTHTPRDLEAKRHDLLATATALITQMDQILPLLNARHPNAGVILLEIRKNCRILDYVRDLT